MSARDLVGYGQSPPDPQWPGGARLALSFVLNYEEGGERYAARGRPGVGGLPARGRRRAADGRPPQPEHGVDVRVRQPRRLLARAPDLPEHGLPLTVYAVGRRWSRTRPPRGRWSTPAGRWRATAGAGSTTWTSPRTRSGSTCGSRSRRSSGPAGAAGRLVHGAELGEHATARRRGGRLPLRLGLLRRRAALLGGRRRPRPPRDPVHARRQRLEVPDHERVRQTADQFHDYLVDSFDRSTRRAAG